MRQLNNKRSLAALLIHMVVIILSVILAAFKVGTDLFILSLVIIPIFLGVILLFITIMLKGGRNITLSRFLLNVILAVFISTTGWFLLYLFISIFASAPGFLLFGILSAPSLGVFSTGIFATLAVWPFHQTTIKDYLHTNDTPT